MRDFEKYIILIFFVVIPILQAVIRKIAESREKARTDLGSRPTPAERSAGGEESEDEEEILPEWFGDKEWEVIEDLEPIREEPIRTEPPIRAEPIRVEPRRPEPPPRATPPPIQVESAGRGSLLPTMRIDLGGAGPAVSAASSAKESRRIPSILPRSSSPHARGIFDGYGQSTGPDDHSHRSVLDTATELQRAVIWSEILGKPRALNPHDPDAR